MQELPENGLLLRILIGEDDAYGGKPRCPLWL